jgi:acetylornithine aminotransferase
MAAANATLETIFESSFLEEVSAKGAFLHQQLKEKLQFPLVKDIRGKGLIAGIECKEPVQALIEALQKEGLLVLPAGPNVIRLLPPLTVAKSEIKAAVEKLKAVMADHSAVKQ